MNFLLFESVASPNLIIFSLSLLFFPITFRVSEENKISATLNAAHIFAWIFNARCTIMSQGNDLWEGQEGRQIWVPLGVWIMLGLPLLHYGCIMEYNYYQRKSKTRIWVPDVGAEAPTRLVDSLHKAEFILERKAFFHCTLACAFPFLKSWASIR